MASVFVIVFLLLFCHGRATLTGGQDDPAKSIQKRNQDLDLLLMFKGFIEEQIMKNGLCKENYELSGVKTIVSDYSMWEREVNLANNIANYLTSMWPYKSTQNYSLVEDASTIYALVRSIVVSSDYIYGSVICFGQNRFKSQQRFCPYAYKDQTDDQNRARVFDQGAKYDYLNGETNVWWKTAQKIGNKSKPRASIDYYDVDFNTGYRESADGHTRKSNSFFNVSSRIVSSNDGAWTTLYYNCFGGEAWVMSYLVPFYDENMNFLGVVGIDIKLDSMEVDQCDFPKNTKIDEARKQFVNKRVFTFYDSHHCKNHSTKCIHVPGKGFSPGNYRCICRKGFYFPEPNGKDKYFDGKDVLKVHEMNKTLYESMFDCLPCREGCDECVDDTPCMYPRSTSLQTVFLALNEIIKALAVALGLFILLFREHKIIKASSPVFMEIIVAGIILMYFEITLGYLEATAAVCITQSWFYHTGFMLAFGSLLLKTWRIVVIFRLRSAKMIELTDMALLRYLAVMMAAVLVYLMIWTWTSTQSFEITTTGDGLKYRRCVRGWFSNAMHIGEILFLSWGVWLCLQVRNAPSAYNESKYIAWCIYNSVFIMILVGLLRLLLDDFHNPDVSYAVDFLATHVIATILLVLLFISKIFLLRNYNKKSTVQRNASMSISNSATDVRKSPFRLNRLVDGSFCPDVDEEREAKETATENMLLREEIRSLNAQLAIYESKQARQQRRKDETLLTPGTQPKSRSHSTSSADVAAKNGSVISQREKGGSLLEDIKNAGKTPYNGGNYLSVPMRNSVSDENLTVVSTVYNDS